MIELEKIKTYIQPDRLEDRLWQLVQIPSPTGHERQIAFVFADMLKKSGATVTIDETIPDSPNVIGRLKGNNPGPVIQLAGHLDHINIAHPPAKRQKEYISGRGAADMKNGLAGILEIIEILHETGSHFPGEILVTAYGLHEAPEGDSKGLFNLLQNGIKGDAAIVFEGPDNAAAVMAKGMSIWNLKISHQRPACHELSTDQDKYELLISVNDCVNTLRKQNQQLSKQSNPYPLLPAESVFIGQMHYGDFYNRLPNECTLQGTFRWHPDKSYAIIKEDFQHLLDAINWPEGISFELDWFYVGDSYEISPEENIVQCLVQSYKEIHGATLPIKGHSSVTDACRFVRNGKIPAVLCGFGTETGHADFEFVKIQQVVDACQVALLTILNYLHS